MTTLKMKTWTHTKPNTPQRDAAIITDAVNEAKVYSALNIRPICLRVALRTLMQLELKG